MIPTEEPFSRCFQEIISRPEDWDPKQGCISLDCINHFLRVLSQCGHIDLAVRISRDLVEKQHANGGWGETLGDCCTEIRETAFCLRNLVGVVKQKKCPILEQSINKAILYLSRKQRLNGSWV